jgi:hypothetical protein
MHELVIACIVDMYYGLVINLERLPLVFMSHSPVYKHSTQAEVQASQNADHSRSLSIVLRFTTRLHIFVCTRQPQSP